MSGRPFALLGVNNDEEISTARKAVEENDLNWRSWYDGDSGPIVEQFGIQSFPTIFVVDHTGVIRYKDIRGEELDEAIELLVTEAEAAGMKGGPAPPPKPKYRFYNDLDGNRHAGTFKSFRNGVVVIEKKDGTEVEFKLDQLSKKDFDYLTENRYLVEETAADGEMVAGVDPNASKGAANDGRNATKRELREFVDSTGKHKTKARFVSVEDGNAVLEKEDGKVVKVPLNRLSEADREYVEKADK